MVRPAAPLAIDAATTKAQADASNPRASAWVSANAGSGKTHVLAYRVIRLLLAGADPGGILCLTFTQRRRGRDGEARLRHPRQMDDPPRRQARRRASRRSSTAAPTRPRSPTRASSSPARWRRPAA